MLITDIGKKIGGRFALALGFFDSLHLGHRHIIARTVAAASAANAVPAVFTFRGEPYRYIKGGGEILTFSERVKKLEELGAGAVFCLEMNERTMHLSPEGFVAELFSTADIALLLCGRDYTFGSGGEGDVRLLKRLASAFGAEVRTEDFVTDGDGKISTARIREALLRGDAATAAALLGEPFCIAGIVDHGYRIGRTLGFPTANIAYPAGKVRLKSGVYRTEVTVDGVRYGGISNVGCRPTFGDGDFKVETYIHGFDGDIYGKNTEVRFLGFMRDVMKFDGADALKKQLEKDKEIFSE